MLKTAKHHLIDQDVTLEEIASGQASMEGWFSKKKPRPKSPALGKAYHDYVKVLGSKLTVISDDREIEDTLDRFVKELDGALGKLGLPTGQTLADLILKIDIERSKGRGVDREMMPTRKTNTSLRGICGYRFYLDSDLASLFNDTPFRDVALEDQEDYKIIHSGETMVLIANFTNDEWVYKVDPVFVSEHRNRPSAKRKRAVDKVASDLAEYFGSIYNNNVDGVDITSTRVSIAPTNDVLTKYNPLADLMSYRDSEFGFADSGMGFYIVVKESGLYVTVGFDWDDGTELLVS